MEFPRLLISLALCVVAFLGPLGGSLARAETRYFPYRDGQLLRRGQHNGGAAFLPPHGAGRAPLPVVVFLHGLNPQGALHRWLGGNGEDLRSLATELIQTGAVRPFVLAAPSQTRNAAKGRFLWDSFDVQDFLATTQAALGPSTPLDMDDVLLVGHSGAGCNHTGGLLGVATQQGQWHPRGVVALDTCLSPQTGATLGGAAGDSLLWVQWQRGWHQNVPGFLKAFDSFASRNVQERIIVEEIRFNESPDEGAHAAIVPFGFERVLRTWLARGSGT